MSELVLSAAQRRRSIAVVIATVSVVAVTLGLTWPLLALNRVGAGLDRALGSRFPDWFDSWIVHLRRRA